MIFINYRREDSDDLVGRLEDALWRRFGREAVFRDRSSMSPGDPWPDRLRDGVRDAEAVLAVIGPRWRTVRSTTRENEGLPRLFDEDDWVRRELTMALGIEGKPVVPVVINDTRMPTAQWLDRFGLAELAKRQAVAVRSGDFDHDLDRLEAALRKRCPSLPRAPREEPPPSGPPSSFEAALARYLDKAIASHETIPVIGFKTELTIPIRFDDLYVPLDAMVDRRVVVDEAFDDADQAQQRLPHADHGSTVALIDAFGVAERYGQRRGLVILGDPGSGKTTHLSAVLLAVAREGGPRLGLPPKMVPVMLPLRHLERPTVSLRDFIAAELDRPHWDLPESFAGELVERGNLLLLLDGLDEVADQGRRAEVARWIDEAVRLMPSCRFVVTCRYAGFKGVRLTHELLELHLRPLETEQAEAFVHRWFRIVETGLADDPAHAEEVAEQRASRLLETLRQPAFRAARVFALTRNPLLLTAICLVHRARGQLPKRRVDLYEECIDVLLQHWRLAKGLQVGMPAEQARKLLRPVALWLHEEEGRREASAAELMPVIDDALVSVDEAGVLGSADAFLRSIRDESGLLTGWGLDRYGLMHLGFQEYLAARELQLRSLDDPTVLRDLAARFDHSWWQEVILLLLALDEPPMFERFMRELVRRPELPRWVESEMMSFCFVDALEASARPFMELLRQPPSDGGLWGHLTRWWSKRPADDRALAERQVAAAELMARHLPEAAAALGLELPEHQAASVRDWWWKRMAPRAGAVVVAPRGGVALVRIPAGRFTMGSPVKEKGRYDDEGPQHEVELEAFLLARTPVTNSQYAEYLRENPGVEEPQYWGDQQYNQPNQPVVGVSWVEAQAYCDWAGLQLPTEAQWEYACRAGTATRYCSGGGENDLRRVGWYEGNSGSRLHSVAELAPNAWGLYDMHGNAYEWCQDGYGSYELAEPHEGDGLRVKLVGDAHRVIRGGSYLVDARHLRSASRNYDHAGDRNLNLGFRPAQGLP